MLTLEAIDNLAAQSRRMGSIPDDYAERRCRWVYDEQHRGKDMWWGKEQSYYKFLYLIAKHYSGGVAIEVGTHAGIGFACLAAGANANRDPKSWTVGIDKDAHQTAAEVATVYSNCLFINGISTEEVKKIEAICIKHDIKVKIMFIDATHTLDWVNAEISAYKHLFDDQVIIIMDDCIHADNNTALPECFEKLPGQKSLHPNLHTDNCIGVALITKLEFDNWNPIIKTGMGL